ncbi:MAG: 30S ribosomal protein S19 [Candidatus Aenigmarchaeota archaeon]|nr:30S ribosomal protein S19 [Candidatus Aenigmarchaeota archaeon]
MAKKFLFRGKTTEELQAMNMEEFSKVIDSRARRALLRGYTKQEKKLIEDIRKNDGKLVRTQCRDMVIVPEMIGHKIGIHNGKEFVAMDIKTEMLGRRLGEFSLTRGRVKHSSPGIGATRSSKAVSLK